MKHLINAYDKCVSDYRLINKFVSNQPSGMIYQGRYKHDIFVTPENYYRFYEGQHKIVGATLSQELRYDYFHINCTLHKDTPKILYNLVKYLYHHPVVKEYDEYVVNTV